MIFEEGSFRRVVFEMPLLARRRRVAGRVGCGFCVRKMDEEGREMVVGVGVEVWVESRRVEREVRNW